MKRPIEVTEEELDAMFESPGDQLERLKAAFRQHPETQHVFWKTPLLGTKLPWAIIGLPDRPGSQVGLLVTGEHADGKWRFDRPFQLLLDSRTGASDLVDVDPAVERIARPTIFSGDYDPAERPEPVSLMAEVSRSSVCWAQDPELVARWAVLATDCGLMPVPTDFAELRFRRDVYRGLIVDGPYDLDRGWDFDAVLKLVCGDGRVVWLDAAQADSVEILFGTEIGIDG
ncbi:hypothetical protein AA12717_0940 [Gluconacetobacter sacchari DSM 12717]|uniref:Uncharacterized protein n=2 Tax=Gluconacetobacter sacchari TaxID=92759 RepID=A0A7W4IF21_9PROT|nr:hypothetical protein [Gluconacetobacter sacchari]MBB2161552.1 hypothetical protein [Gluconacetobacter sacchari]GBQ21599.1 hypothetical protein AA12717_0940 [Gluconacetobacter sacchari DSM 12717]